MAVVLEGQERQCGREARMGRGSHLGRLPSVARREERSVLDVVHWVCVLLCLGLSGCATTAPERAMLPLPADPEPQIQLAWTPPATMGDDTPAVEVVWYKIYYGPDSRQYSFYKTLGPQTKHGLVGLVPERTYYVAVTAYDRTGTESSLSEDLTVVVPPQARHRHTLMQESLWHGQPTQFWVTKEPGSVRPSTAACGWILSSQRSLEEVTADAVGTATVTHTMPAEMLPRQLLAFQAVIRRGSEGEQAIKTNAITARVMD
jgi:hypothetical protein